MPRVSPDLLQDRACGGVYRMQVKDQSRAEKHDNAIDALVAEARVYMTWLNSDRPLDDGFRAIKARIVTLACIVANTK